MVQLLLQWEHSYRVSQESRQLYLNHSCEIRIDIHKTLLHLFGGSKLQHTAWERALVALKTESRLHLKSTALTVRGRGWMAQKSTTSWNKNLEMQCLVAKQEAREVFLQESVQPRHETRANGGIPIAGPDLRRWSPTTLVWQRHQSWSQVCTHQHFCKSVWCHAKQSCWCPPCVSPPKMYFLPPSFLFGEQETSQCA